jgi:hypothetical protein
VGRHGKGKNRRNIKIKKLILNFKKIKKIEIPCVRIPRGLRFPRRSSGEFQSVSPWDPRFPSFPHRQTHRPRPVVQPPPRSSIPITHGDDPFPALSPIAALRGIVQFFF